LIERETEFAQDLQADVYLIRDRREGYRRLIKLKSSQFDFVAEARLFDFNLITHGARPANSNRLRR